MDEVRWRSNGQERPESLGCSPSLVSVPFCAGFPLGSIKIWCWIIVVVGASWRHKSSDSDGSDGACVGPAKWSGFLAFVREEKNGTVPQEEPTRPYCMSKEVAGMAGSICGLQWS
jgi:hypothetical protein